MFVNEGLRLCVFKYWKEAIMFRRGTISEIGFTSIYHLAMKLNAPHRGLDISCIWAGLEEMQYNHLKMNNFLYLIKSQKAGSLGFNLEKDT